MAPQSPGTILIIDDEPGFVRALARLLCRDGYTVDTAESGQLAFAQLHTHHSDVLLCDLRMPGLSGADFFDLLVRQDAALRQRVIFLTGDTMGAESLAFLEQCGQPWLYKPCDIAEIRHTIQQVLQAVSS